MLFKQKGKKLIAFPSDTGLALKLITNIIAQEACMHILLFCLKRSTAEVWLSEIKNEYMKLSEILEIPNIAYFNDYVEMLQRSRLIEVTIYHCQPYQKYGITLTRAGYVLGQPIASFCLSYQYEKNISLGNILGGRRTINLSTLDKSEPFRRFAVLQGLAKIAASKSVRRYQLEYIFRFNIESSLQHLQEIGLIDINSQKIEKHYVYSNYFSTGKSNDSIGLELIASNVLNYANIRRRPVTTKELVSVLGFAPDKIEKAILRLLKSGLMKGKDCHPVYREANVSLTKNGAEFWEELCLPIKNFLESPSTKINCLG